MQGKEILFPVLAQVFLTFIVQRALMSGRLGSIKRARVHPQVIADPVRFDEIMKGRVENISDNFENLFEMPVLFYVAAVLILVLQLTDALYLGAFWAFVVLRAVHSYIHCTHNKVVQRFYAYFLSSILVWAIWVRLGIQIVSR